MFKMFLEEQKRERENDRLRSKKGRCLQEEEISCRREYDRRRDEQLMELNKDLTGKQERLERKLAEIESVEKQTTVSFKTKEPDLTKLTNSDDVENFLTTFVRIATACKWSKEL